MKTRLIYLRMQNYNRRKLASIFVKKIHYTKKQQATISFTFDDFPRTAYLVGGSILKRYNFKATYYASFGLMGSNAPSGKIFLPQDVENLIRDGNELACHTYDHCNSWQTGKNRFKKSIIANQKTLKELFPQLAFRTFSYPISTPHPRNKSIAESYYCCSRGGNQEINGTRIDANLLKSYFIDKKNRDNFTELKNIINSAVSQKAWLIISTHDICENPSPFGCSPAYFERLVKYVASKEICVLSVFNAFQAYRK